MSFRCLTSLTQTRIVSTSAVPTTLKAAACFTTSSPFSKSSPTPSSGAQSIPARQPSDKFTQGYTSNPQHPDSGLVSPFASESVSELYKPRAPSPASETPLEQGSSTSADPPHPYTTSKVPHTSEDAVGSSASVRYRDPSWENKEGGNYGVGLMDEGSVVKNKESKLAERNEWPSEEQGRQGIKEAWKGRK